MINQYIIDSDGIVYIGIKNVDNRFCYYISALQRLHSSLTLTQSLQNIQNNSKFERYRIILKPLEIYSKIRIDNKYKINNVQEVYNELETELINTTNNLSDKLQHGGNPDHVLISLFLPAIYNVFGLNVVKNTIHELYINPNRLNFLLYDNSRIHDFELTKDNSLNDELYNGFGELQKALKDEPLEGGNKPFNFKISTMSIMFKDMYGQQSKYNGHALNIIKGTNDEGVNDLYIIDDSVGISPFQIYLERHANRIGYWEVKDATDKLLQELQGYKGIDIDKRLHRDVINIVNSNNSNLNGGDSENDDSENDENIKQYKEEIVNDCNWCPFVSVKDVNENSKNKQEIYGVIGGSLNSNLDKNLDKNENEDKNKNLDKNENKNEDLNKDKDENLDKDENQNQNVNSNENKNESKLSKFKQYIIQHYNTPLNKYLSYGIIILIIIIIVSLIVRRKNVKKNRKKIETYINKIKDVRQKNINLATQIIKTKESIEKPKKEVEMILKAGDKNNKKYEMPSSRDKMDFFHSKIPILAKYQSPINRFSGYNFSFKS
jgi:hypothetical protein